MNNYFADLHVHIGRAGNGAPVKITASTNLSVPNILRECVSRKGIDMVGIVDTSSPDVQEDLIKLVQSGDLEAMENGGLLYRDSVTLVPGSEVETTECVYIDGKEQNRSAHCLCYFPGLDEMKQFTGELSKQGRTRNIGLSSQKCNMSIQEIVELAEQIGGIVVPAHAFTPHKGMYGSCVRSAMEIMSPEIWAKIPAVELGLSSDSNYADMISELSGKSLISNSDAHSLSKIGREYNVIRMRRPDYNELVMALRRENGRSVIANHGFDPKLGKYHRTYCEGCGFTAHDEPPVMCCPVCGVVVDGRTVVKGVLDRIHEIRDNIAPMPPEHRPPYFHQIPLENLPGIGKKTMDKLLQTASEMQILHHYSQKELEKLAGCQAAETIILARQGKLKVSAGGGGYYGRVEKRKR
ncbi:endonuclease Q family protein [Phosphitispora sp. TUW77]|uniref:endonuclease Q family protein n=1 Tax=Phosphitispora sp. TUW77 TaxID=3152361 RepID=UPI003AB8DB52